MKITRTQRTLVVAALALAAIGYRQLRDEGGTGDASKRASHAAAPAPVDAAHVGVIIAPLAPPHEVAARA